MKKIRNIFIRAPAILVISVFCAITFLLGCGASGHEHSLKNQTSVKEVPDANGFIQRWLILEPIGTDDLIDNTIREAVSNESFPNQLSVIPYDGYKVTVGGTKLTWHAFDTEDYNVNLHYLAQALDKPTSNVLFWAVTTINCPQEMPGVRLAVGSNATSIWWINGEEVIEITCDCQNTIDGGASKRLTLKKGANIVRCAVISGDGATSFCARFLDSDGEPLKGFTVSASDIGK